MLYYGYLYNFVVYIYNVMCFVLCRSHEQMSVNMVDYIVEEHNIDIESQMLKRVKVMLLFAIAFLPILCQVY